MTSQWLGSARVKSRADFQVSVAAGLAKVLASTMPCRARILSRVEYPGLSSLRPFTFLLARESLEVT